MNMLAKLLGLSAVMSAVDMPDLVPIRIQASSQGMKMSTKWWKKRKRRLKLSSISRRINRK